jgi:hypothetical protein
MGERFCHRPDHQRGWRLPLAQSVNLPKPCASGTMVYRYHYCL